MLIVDVSVENEIGFLDFKEIPNWCTRFPNSINFARNMFQKSSKFFIISLVSYNVYE